MYNMYGMDPNMFGGPATLVLNANNELVQYIFNHKDSEHVPMMCEQLYDLAMLSHKPLAPEEMTKFITHRIRSFCRCSCPTRRGHTRSGCPVRLPQKGDRTMKSDVLILLMYSQIRQVVFWGLLYIRWQSG